MATTLDSFFQGLMGGLRGSGGGPTIPRSPYLTPAASEALGLPFAGMDPALMGMAPPMAAPPPMPMMASRMPTMPRMAMPKVPRVAPMAAYAPVATGFGRFSSGFTGRAMPTGGTLTRRAMPAYGGSGNAYGRIGQASRSTGGFAGPGFGFGRVGRGASAPTRGTGRPVGRTTPPLQRPRRGLGRSTGRSRRGF